MTAILILGGIVVVIISTIVLVTVPVKHAEAVARDFRWRRSMRIGTRVWVKKKSKRQPKPSIDIRNAKVQNADDPDKLRYTYEERVWRNMRSFTVSGLSQETVRDPEYILGRDEEVRGRSELYEATFVSEKGRRYAAKVQFAQWKLLRKGAKYQLGRNTFGRVRTIKPARHAANQRPQNVRIETCSSPHRARSSLTWTGTSTLKSGNWSGSLAER